MKALLRFLASLRSSIAGATRQRVTPALLVCLTIAWNPGTAMAAISGQERTGLINFYLNTGGDSWTVNTNWLGAAGTECSWFGVTCDGTGSHVVYLILPSNNLVGAFPDLTLQYLTELTALELYQNHLTGSLYDHPESHLQYFLMDNNAFTGHVPVFSSSIVSVGLSVNQLDGPFPDISAYSNLTGLGLSNNHLTGSIPSLAGNPLMQYFYVSSNQFTGSLPSLAPTPALVIFLADGNQFSGGIPDISSLTQLSQFSVSHNHLVGQIPSLTTLSALTIFRVGNNALTGTVPFPPASANLQAGYSTLCPNPYPVSSYYGSTAWDAATGSVPWYAACDPVFSNGFEAQP